MSGPRVQNTESLYFHRIGGKEIRLQENSTVAERTRGSRFFNGLVFFHRPVKHQEEISLKILNFDPNWKINLGLGVTTTSPRACSSQSLLEEPFHELIKKNEWWGRGVEDTYLQINGILTLKFNIYQGTVDLQVKKQDNHEETILIKNFVTFTRVHNPSDRPTDLWMFLHLRGNHIKVQLLPGPNFDSSNRNSHGRFRSNCLGASCLPVREGRAQRQSQNRSPPSRRFSAVSGVCETNRTDDFNYLKWIQDCFKSYVPTVVSNFLQAGSSLVSPLLPNESEDNHNSSHPQTAAGTTTSVSRGASTRRRTENNQTNQNSPEAESSSFSRNANSSNSTRTRASTVPVISTVDVGSSGNSVTRTRTLEKSLKYPDVVPGSLQFHSAKGRSIYINRKGFKALRRNVSGCQKNCYLFIANPIEPGQHFVIRIESKDEEIRGSFNFGITSCNPSSLNFDELPADPKTFVMDRPDEYWVHAQNNFTALELNVGDELCFTRSESGAMRLSRNGGASEHLFYISISIPVWAWFNLVESVSGIYVLGKGTSKQNGSSRTRNRRTNSERISQLELTTSPSSSSTCTPFLSHHIPPIPSAPPLHFIDPVLPSSSALSSSVSSPSPSSSLSPLGFEEVELAEEAEEDAATRDAQFSPPPTDCVICMDEDVNSCVIPCGHLAMCFSCAQKYWKSTADVGCPLCRKPITNIIQTFKA